MTGSRCHRGEPVSTVLGDWTEAVDAVERGHMAEHTEHTTPDPIPAPPEPAPVPDPERDPAPPRRWSAPSLVLLGFATVVLGCATAWHLGAVFLSVAPANTLSQRYQTRIDAYVYPEFEQNWQLFAPNPLQSNIAVEVRVRTMTAGGVSAQSGWIDLTAQDLARIHDNPMPSHADQNLLRRAWDYYTSWHTQSDGASLGYGGPLSQEYLKRIALQRTGRDWGGSPVTELEFRSATTPVTGPAWTGAPRTTTTSYAVLPWWPVADSDFQGLAR